MLNSPNNPEKPLTLGILGGGQLAKMLALAAYRMGLNISIIEGFTDSPAGDMTKSDFAAGWENEEELQKFIDSADVFTLENEFIDPAILQKIQDVKPLFPSVETFALVQDKYIQKNTFLNAGLPVPEFRAIDSIDEAIAFAKEFGYPFVVKARKYGYDGYGNATIFKEEEIIEAWKKFNTDKVQRPLMAEKFVDFSKELAVIIARNRSGEISVYPCVETIQYRHICHSCIAPAEISEDLQRKAQQIAEQAVVSINGIGVFGLEMFLTKSGEILINEIAPRTHNSGHYSIEACHTSQFENAIRAVLDLPLGSGKLVTPSAAMVNLLGSRTGSGVPEDIRETLLHNNISLHLYNKKSCRPGRKMGHITALGSNQSEAFNRANSAASALKW